MTGTITARNVNEAFNIAVLSLRGGGLIEMPSRNGTVLMFRNPLVTAYKRPYERVLLSPERNCNPFFHFVEGLWMIAGRNDLATLTEFAKKMADFSDDGVLVNGAYGYRWRNWFDNDQLATAVKLLKANPYDRRVVLQMWDTTKDLDSSSKDVPCNTQVYFKAIPINDQVVLDMTVTNRSNDLIWGAYGANAVHFSMVHEYVAAMSGCRMGTYYQISNNAHVYKEVWDPLEKKLPIGVPIDPYDSGEIEANEALVTDPETFGLELGLFFDWLHEGDFFGTSYSNRIFAGTAVPMVESWWLWKEGMLNDAIDLAKTIKSLDWRKACVEWLQRKK